MGTYKRRVIRGLPAAILCCLFLPLIAQAQSGLVEERVSDENGFISTCGEGAGLNPCRDVNGETYDEEVRGPSIDMESDDELAAEAAHVRHESPKELQQTIGELEQGINPDDHATEGLPH